MAVPQPAEVVHSPENLAQRTVGGEIAQQQLRDITRVGQSSNVGPLFKTRPGPQPELFKSTLVREIAETIIKNNGADHLEPSFRTKDNGERWLIPKNGGYIAEVGVASRIALLFSRSREEFALVPVANASEGRRIAGWIRYLFYDIKNCEAALVEDKGRYYVGLGSKGAIHNGLSGAQVADHSHPVSSPICGSRASRVDKLTIVEVLTDSASIYGESGVTRYGRKTLSSGQTIVHVKLDGPTFPFEFITMVTEDKEGAPEFGPQIHGPLSLTAPEYFATLMGWDPEELRLDAETQLVLLSGRLDRYKDADRISALMDISTLYEVMGDYINAMGYCRQAFESFKSYLSSCKDEVEIRSLRRLINAKPGLSVDGATSLHGDIYPADVPLRMFVASLGRVAFERHLSILNTKAGLKGKRGMARTSYPEDRFKEIIESYHLRGQGNVSGSDELYTYAGAEAERRSKEWDSCRDKRSPKARHAWGLMRDAIYRFYLVSLERSDHRMATKALEKLAELYEDEIKKNFARNERLDLCLDLVRIYFRLRTIYYHRCWFKEAYDCRGRALELLRYVDGRADTRSTEEMIRDLQKAGGIRDRYERWVVEASERSVIPVINVVDRMKYLGGQAFPLDEKIPDV